VFYMMELSLLTLTPHRANASHSHLYQQTGTIHPHTSSTTIVHLLLA
jgi:hypothetical protein